MAYDKKTGRTLKGDEIEREFVNSRMPDSPKCCCGRWASFGGKCSLCNSRESDRETQQGQQRA